MEDSREPSLCLLYSWLAKGERLRDFCALLEGSERKVGSRSPKSETWTVPAPRGRTIPTEAFRAE